MSLLSAGTTAVSRGPACTLSFFPSFVQAIYLFAVLMPSISVEKNKTKTMGRVQHVELEQQILVCKCHFM